MLFPSSYFSVQWISFLLPLLSSPFHRNSGPVLTSLHFSAATRRHILPFLRISTPITSSAAHRIANQFPSLLHLAFPLRISGALLRHSNSWQLNSKALQGIASLLPRKARLLSAPARQISAMLLPLRRNALLCHYFAKQFPAIHCSGFAVRLFTHAYLLCAYA